MHPSNLSVHQDPVLRTPITITSKLPEMWRVLGLKLSNRSTTSSHAQHIVKPTRNAAALNTVQRKRVVISTPSVNQTIRRRGIRSSASKVIKLQHPSKLIFVHDFAFVRLSPLLHLCRRACDWFSNCLTSDGSWQHCCLCWTLWRKLGLLQLWIQSKGKGL